MRIAFYAPMKPPTAPVPSGDRRMARLLIAALGRAGGAVELAATFRSYDRGDPLRQARLEALGHRLAARLIRRYRASEARPDLWFTYHLYHKAPDHLGPAVARALAIPYVVAEASHAGKQEGGPFARGHRSAAAAIRAAARIYSINPADDAGLAKLLPDPAAILRPLPPFLDTGPFAAAAAARPTARAALASATGLDSARPILLTAAMMRADQKLLSYQSLAAALAQLGDTAGWQLAIAGDGPARAAVEALMRPFGRRVAWLGEVSEAQLPAIYAAADLFVWPAVKEAFGMVFLEAAAAGLPIVAGRSGGIGHLIEDGESGLVVPPGDAAATAAALRRLLLDPARAQRLGAAAAVRARTGNGLDHAAAILAADLAALSLAGGGPAP